MNYILVNMLQVIFYFSCYFSFLFQFLFQFLVFPALNSLAYIIIPRNNEKIKINAKKIYYNICTIEIIIINPYLSRDTMS